MRRAAMLLSGCGNMDGTEIHESVSAIIALDLSGWEIVYTAPDVPQSKTVSHLTNKTIQPRNALVEAARIARGKIQKLSPELADEVDAAVIPGGLGAALTLCDFGDRGSDCTADAAVLEFLGRLHEQGKPIAAMCIAPALVARCIPGINVTIGTDTDTAVQIENMGCRHTRCAPEEAVSDAVNRIVTTPAYMTAGSPSQVFKGAVKMVEKLEELIDNAQ